tara:strand:+ start:180 stop:497 length:318 start_codon:yes stop_codon:yes gene_type:complete
MSVVDIEGVKNRVLYLLETEPHLRDSDEKLIANIWYDDLNKKKIDPTKITAMQFLKLLADGKISNCQSIHRAGRDLKKAIPELKGKNDDKKKEKEKRIREHYRNQ